MSIKISISKKKVIPIKCTFCQILVGWLEIGKSESEFTEVFIHEKISFSGNKLEVFCKACGAYLKISIKK